MIGYILLIVIAISISVLVYQGVKTLVPKEEIKCSEGVSLSVDRCTIDSEGTINLYLINNGRFGIGGAFVRGAINEEEIPTESLLEVIDSGDPCDSSNDCQRGDDETGICVGGLCSYEKDYWTFTLNENAFLPNNQDIITTKPGQSDIKLIEIVPFRYEEIEGRNRFVICGESAIRQDVNQNQCEQI